MNEPKLDTHKLISSRGGKAGKGEAKRRSAQHYAEMNRRRWEKYRAAKAEKEKAGDE